MVEKITFSDQWVKERYDVDKFANQLPLLMSALSSMGAMVEENTDTLNNYASDPTRRDCGVLGRVYPLSLTNQDRLSA